MVGCHSRTPAVMFWVSWRILAHAVAVVVVGDVLAPVHQRGLGLLGFLAVVVGVDLLCRGHRFRLLG